MSKRLILVLALAFVVGIAFAAYAEVQNVKVGGDITVYGVNRHNYSVEGSGALRALTIGPAESRDNYMTTIRLKIDADLTDNVATTIRLINERDWLASTTTSENSNIDVDLAYVTLKEFLYSPLTLKIGRQEIHVGSGLVLGNGMSKATYVTTTDIIADDLTSRKAFDAIVATMDYDPLILSLGIAKLAEVAQSSTDDTDAYLMDAVYKFKDYNAVADVTYLLSHASSRGSTQVKGMDTHVIDLRLTADPIKNLSTELEYARQFGVYSVGKENAGWALTSGLKYALADIKSIAKYAPVVGVKYDYRSGNKDVYKNYKAWQPLYEDQVNGVIYDPNSNISIINVSASVKPTEDTILSANYYNYKLDQRVVTVESATRKTNKDAGDELDLNLTYNYTEDVSFGLLGAIFWPGKTYVEDHTATELLGSMKVTF